MSETPERDMPEAGGPSQGDMFSDASDPDSIDASRTGRRPLSIKTERALERLRDRISLTARELRRLREENVRLHRQVEELQTRGLGEVEGTPVVFTEDAAALRSKVERFIESIDLHLAGRSVTESGDGSGSPAP